ncbi:MAG: circularly permuted type 2 ATP-grasp protein [Actinomycetota bacterium]
MALLAGYSHEGWYDEVFADDGSIRPHYRSITSWLEDLSPDALVQRASMRDAAFRTQGITFSLSGDAEGLERTFPMDLVPRIIPFSDWRHIEQGLVQRISALNQFLEDIYTGDGAIVRDGIVPAWLVKTSRGFVRQAVGIPVPHGTRCVVAGIDLVRDAQGSFLVLEDNLRVPSGISYVIENRVAMTRLLPKLFGHQRVQPVSQYPALLHSALQTVAPSGTASPTVVVLTPGIHNAAYFEHAFLARQMGIELVEGRDLAVDGHELFARTTRGPVRVDVVYSRVSDAFLDPVAFRRDSLLGVPGLMTAARAGSVAVANPVGNGLADDKAVYPFVPEMIRYYLGAEPILPNVPTYLLWEPDQRAHVLERLDRLIVKPVDGAGGHGMLVGPEAAERDLEEFRKNIEAHPRWYIAQEIVRLSRHPTLVGDHLEGRHIDLRPFVVSGDSIHVVPGGLTRVALQRGSLVVNSSQGGGSKDTWVLAAPAAGAGADDAPSEVPERAAEPAGRR